MFSWMLMVMLDIVMIVGVVEAWKLVLHSVKTMFRRVDKKLNSIKVDGKVK